MRPQLFYESLTFCEWEFSMSLRIGRTSTKYLKIENMLQRNGSSLLFVRCEEFFSSLEYLELGLTLQIELLTLINDIEASQSISIDYALKSIYP